MRGVEQFTTILPRDRSITFGHWKQKPISDIVPLGSAKASSSPLTVIPSKERERKRRDAAHH